MLRRLLWLWLYSIACAFYILADWARDYTADMVRGDAPGGDDGDDEPRE